jgi:hypothetical protein
MSESDITMQSRAFVVLLVVLHTCVHLIHSPLCPFPLSPLFSPFPFPPFFLFSCLFLFPPSHHWQVQFTNNQEAEYLAAFTALNAQSYTSPLPPALVTACAAKGAVPPPGLECNTTSDPSTPATAASAQVPSHVPRDMPYSKENKKEEEDGKKEQ